MAEATARIVAAEQASQEVIAQHLLAAREVEDTLSSPGRLGVGPGRRPAPPRDSPRRTWLAWFFDDRDNRMQQAADEREARREQATAEREARREEQHAAPELAAFRESPPTGSPSCSYP